MIFNQYYFGSSIQNIDASLSRHKKKQIYHMEVDRARCSGAHGECTIDTNHSASEDIEVSSCNNQGYYSKSETLEDRAKIIKDILE